VVGHVFGRDTGLGKRQNRRDDRKEGRRMGKKDAIIILQIRTNAAAMNKNAQEALTGRSTISPIITLTVIKNAIIIATILKRCTLGCR
jgi:hypothetical protein